MSESVRWRLAAAILVGLAVLWGADGARAETIARCGAGWLESDDGYLVLHLKGSPYEMGYQHGALLADHVRENMEFILDELRGPAIGIPGVWKLNPRSLLRGIAAYQRRFVPESYYEELAGLAAGAEIPLDAVVIGNFVPEFMHCSGFALAGSATADGTLLHGRVLDYAIHWRLQEHAVLIVAEPDGGIPFANVSYAGFVGSVTGMNARQVSIGEMGGGGYGHWSGVPMAVLVRQVLESAHDLDEAIAIFRDQPRTCQYFYVIADAKSNRAVGLEASWNRFEVIAPGEANRLLPTPVDDCVLLSAGDRYCELVDRVEKGHGTFTAEKALRLMDRPVAMQSNLHNALFHPATQRLWVANATPDKQPAAEQPYHEFSLTELLARRPDPQARELPLVNSRMRGPAETADR